MSLKSQFIIISIYFVIAIGKENITQGCIDIFVINNYNYKIITIITNYTYMETQL